MKNKINALIVGLIIGLLVPIIAIYIFFLFSNHQLSWTDYLNHLFRYKLVSHVISIGAISNLLVFFGFSRFDYLKAARGVVFATMLYAIFVAIVKFI